eukprot:CAMPEP_0170303528 /NCGR_PEP_ID=MMETSP0116_2-20130129/52086_1 /TAXON_ID=400756 /ORGANISM="Durinskia baltica, Strain CSIRO CS-38" /LENGTH=72 /DNA_ID=CAMNT_0010555475 /DNA_START=183 /DNA_END=398 /DNA_ORIENTATION=+
MGRADFKTDARWPAPSPHGAPGDPGGAQPCAGEARSIPTGGLTVVRSTRAPRHDRRFDTRPLMSSAGIADVT